MCKNSYGWNQRAAVGCAESLIIFKNEVDTMNVTKTLTAIAAATVTALALAGCGGSADTASSSASDSSGTGGETAEIRFSWWGGDSRHDAISLGLAAV